MKYMLLAVPEMSTVNKLIGRLKPLRVIGVKVVGVFATPDAEAEFCSCTLSERQQASETRLGDKYGWYIHLGCGKPRKQRAYGPRNLLELGKPVGTRQYFITAHEE